jgi:hypothetical protein
MLDHTVLGSRVRSRMDPIKADFFRVDSYGLVLSEGKSCRPTERELGWRAGRSFVAYLQSEPLGGRRERISILRLLP